MLSIRFNEPSSSLVLERTSKERKNREDRARPSLSLPSTDTTYEGHHAFLAGDAGQFVSGGTDEQIALEKHSGTTRWLVSFSAPEPGRKAI